MTAVTTCQHGFAESGAVAAGAELEAVMPQIVVLSSSTAKPAAMPAGQAVVAVAAAAAAGVVGVAASVKACAVLVVGVAFADLAVAAVVPGELAHYPPVADFVYVTAEVKQPAVTAVAAIGVVAVGQVAAGVVLFAAAVAASGTEPAVIAAAAA